MYSFSNCFSRLMPVQSNQKCIPSMYVKSIENDCPTLQAETSGTIVTKRFDWRGNHLGSCWVGAHRVQEERYLSFRARGCQNRQSTGEENGMRAPANVKDGVLKRKRCHSLDPTFSVIEDLINPTGARSQAVGQADAFCTRGQRLSYLDEIHLGISFKASFLMAHEFHKVSVVVAPNAWRWVALWNIPIAPHHRPDNTCKKNSNHWPGGCLYTQPRAWASEGSVDANLTQPNNYRLIIA